MVTAACQSLNASQSVKIAQMAFALLQDNVNAIMVMRRMQTMCVHLLASHNVSMAIAKRQIAAYATRIMKCT